MAKLQYPINCTLSRASFKLRGRRVHDWRKRRRFISLARFVVEATANRPIINIPETSTRPNLESNTRSIWPALSLKVLSFLIAFRILTSTTLCPLLALQSYCLSSPTSPNMNYDMEDNQNSAPGTLSPVQAAKLAPKRVTEAQSTTKR